MQDTPKTRYSLIGKLHDPQNLEAWNEFASIYQPLIFRICRQRGLQHADATDVTQEVMSRVSKAIGTFDGQQQGATFRGWLYRVTRNLVIDFFRRKENRQVAGGETGLLELIAANPGEAESHEFRLEYQRQIFSLVTNQVRDEVNPKTWQAFWRTEVENASVDSVAKSLDMNRGAVYVARSRVIARLRKAAERRIIESGESFDV
ncbi:RNA polymerase sigma factor [Mariniblastus fucicola]|uniref:ECF RNA polymerase sigma factor SigE n=1 Tax=Mariniblastus fucicola TaxID=980251 RepID=A0A5B9PBD8_9BACT|nr:sigma-70 family RNA polymerase sigma factor [Mariniblastus fucicola]QEG22310.1 ECF RNA polymerase sigma factor SigE [Mariniblastus fucicola]